MPVVSLVPYSFGAHHVRCAEFDDVAQRVRCRTVVGRSSATKFGSPWTGVDSFYIQCRSGVDDGVLAGITRIFRMTALTIPKNLRAKSITKASQKPSCVRPVGESGAKSYSGCVPGLAEVMWACPLGLSTRSC